MNPVILDYSNRTSIDLNEYVALYQPDRYDYVMNGKRISVIRKDGIFVNVESRKFASFSYIAQALCHEMIHAYDMHFGSLFNYGGLGKGWMMMRGYFKDHEEVLREYAERTFNGPHTHDGIVTSIKPRNQGRV